MSSAFPLSPTLDNHPLALPRSLRFPRSGFQAVSVFGTLRQRCLVTFRAPAGKLETIVREAAGGSRHFEIDSRNGEGFLSICAVDLAEMRIAGTPRAFAFDNREFLYRIGVRLPSGEPTFVTLRSDVSSRFLAFVGPLFSHYRPKRGDIQCRSEGELWTLTCNSADGLGDAEVTANLRSASERCPTSCFTDARDATDFLLGMAGSAASGTAGLQLQRIEHSDWSPRFVEAPRLRFAFLDALAQLFALSLTYDSTLSVAAVAQRWCGAQLGSQF